MERKKKFWMRSIWVSAVLCLIFPMIGLLVSAVGMRRAFSSLGSDGVADPAALSEHIGQVLIATACGVIFSVPCLVFLIVSTIQLLSVRTKLRLSAA